MAIAEFAGLSLRDIYRLKCEELTIKKNSKLMKELPTTPDAFDEPTKMDLSGNFVGPKGLVALLHVVKMALGLRYIDLRDNQLTNQSVAEICDVAQTHKSLALIDLSDNPITIGAGKMLLDLARANPQIEEIHLANTGIREMMLRAIEAQLEKNRATARQEAERAEQTVTTREGAATDDVDPVRLRAVLTDIPASVHEFLFDDNPADRISALCQQQNALLTDLQFPPGDVSVQRAPLKDYGVVAWRRAGTLMPVQRLFGDSANVDDVELGAAATGWLFAAAAALQRGGQRVEQLFYPRHYNACGVYAVKFFVDGRWRWVLVDDLVPVDADERPVFARVRAAATPCLWPLLLEKAAAKLHGSYQALDDAVATTHPQEKPHSCAAAMMGVSGGVGVSRDLHQESFVPGEWWEELLDLHARGAHICATIGSRERSSVEDAGLQPFHAYAILSVRAINGFRLLRLRNPWMGDSQWVGEWGDHSTLWDQYDDIKTALDFKGKCDGSFWMPYPLFCKYFGAVHITKTFDQWNAALLAGEWVKRAAGGPYFEESWAHNPRYKFTLQKSGKVFLNLSVPDSRFNTSMVDTIAFHVLKSDYYPMRYDKDNVVVRTSYLITNSVSFEGELEAGTYWLIPSAYVAGKESIFYIRMFSDAPFSLQYEHEEKYWRGITLKSHWHCAGEYQSGEDHPQFALKLPPHPDPARVLLSLSVDESDENCVVILVCTGGGGGRMLGAIDDEQIVIKSKYLISSTVQVQCELPGGDEPYVVVPVLQPEGARSACTLKCWCSQARFSLTELPMWGRKSAEGEWTQSSTYQDANGNPQFELVCPIPGQQFVIKLDVGGHDDPSCLFFVVDNNGKQGRGLRGLIPESAIVCTSTYIRAESVSREYKLPASPSDSYLIVPNLQPPGSAGRCTITVSCPSDDFSLHRVLE